MKVSLALLVILSLALGAMACAGSPDAQNNESESGIDSNSTLSRVALEVPTIM